MANLPTRTLGRTGLEVTTLGYGAMELRGAPRGRDVSDEQADRILNAVLDAGINFIDTSIDYGLAEERIGKFISKRRSEYFLASKCGCVTGDLATNPPATRPGDRSPHVYTAENVTRGVNQSLERMKTDYLDLVQFHMSPTRAELEEHGALQALLDLQREGKVRHVGISGTLPNIKQQIDMGVFEAFQIPYSALDRAHETAIAEASEAGAGIVIRGGAAKGGPGKEQGDMWAAWQRVGIDDLLDGMTRMEFIMRFTYSNPHLDTTIVGTVNPEHLQDNVSALVAGSLPTDVYEEAKRRLADAGSVPTPLS